jgi:hypothetical protein
MAKVQPVTPTERRGREGHIETVFAWRDDQGSLGSARASIDEDFVNERLWRERRQLLQAFRIYLSEAIYRWEKKAPVARLERRR